MPKFDDEENKKIDKLTYVDLSVDAPELFKKIIVRDNMKNNLVLKLSEFTRKLKINEEEYIKKYRELVGDDIKYSGSDYNNLDSNSNLNKNGQFLNFENSNDILKKRDNEINNLLSSINELATIFKDFQTLVLEQGTILDRIDYNIETAFTNTRDAHCQLEKANKNMEKNCSRNTNLILIAIIFILSILLILKYVK